MTLRIFGVVGGIAMLSACVTTTTVSSSHENITVKALNGSDATPVAEAHCNQLGKAASFNGSAREGRTAYSTYFFDCN